MIDGLYDVIDGILRGFTPTPETIAEVEIDGETYYLRRETNLEYSISNNQDFKIFFHHRDLGWDGEAIISAMFEHSDYMSEAEKRKMVKSLIINGQNGDTNNLEEREE